MFREQDSTYAARLKSKAVTAYAYGKKKPGNTQTSCYLSPYFYEEDNWVDDMELAAVQMYTLTQEDKFLTEAFDYANLEKQTPWLGKDTAGHYQ